MFLQVVKNYSPQKRSMFVRHQSFRKEEVIKMSKSVGNKGTVLCLPIPDYPWQSKFCWDDVYAGEAIRIRKVKYITS